MNKGDKGYLKRLKRKEGLKCMVQFGMVFTFLIVGYVTTKTRLNWFTFVAVLSCLPASKTLVGVIVKWCIHPLSMDCVSKVEAGTEYMTVIYDPILTSKEKSMPLGCIVISGNKVFGYTGDKNCNIEKTTEYLKEIYSKHKYEKVNVKLFHEFTPFLTRVEGLNNIAKIEQIDHREVEENMKHDTLLYCM